MAVGFVSMLREVLLLLRFYLHFSASAHLKSHFLSQISVSKKCHLDLLHNTSQLRSLVLFFRKQRIRTPAVIQSLITLSLPFYLVEPCSVLLEVHYTDLTPYKQRSDLFSIDVHSHPQIRAEVENSPTVSRGRIPPS